MMVFISPYRWREWFGMLLSDLYQFGLPTKWIGFNLALSSFLRPLEENDFDIVEKRLGYQVAKDVFGKEVWNMYPEKDVAELVWAGYSYIAIHLNTNIPLRTLLLQLDLEEMLTLYPVFHEMNEIEIVKEYKIRFASRSVLRKLRQWKRYSVSELSATTGIKARTIIYYEESAEHLAGASYETTASLAKALNVDDALFLTKSQSVPMSYSLFASDEFLLPLTKRCLALLKIDDSINDQQKEVGVPSIFGKRKEEAEEEAKKWGQAFIYGSPSYFISFHGRTTTRRIVDTNALTRLILAQLQEAREHIVERLIL